MMIEMIEMIFGFLCVGILATPIIIIIAFVSISKNPASLSKIVEFFEPERDRQRREAHNIKIHAHNENMKIKQLQVELLRARLYDRDLDIEIKRARLIGSDLRNTLTDYKVEDVSKTHNPPEFKSHDYPDPDDRK